MTKILSFLLILTSCLPSNTPLDGATLLKRSMAFHDPNKVWETVQLTLEFEETRPSSEPRYTTIEIDNLSGNVCITRTETETKVERHVVNDVCSYRIEEQTRFSEKEIEKYRLNDERTFMLRNYYLYLWGLPMKLSDQGTIVDNLVTRVMFNEVDALKLSVTYEEATGGDIWYYYFNPTTYEMIGYQFFHDELKQDGEYIVLGNSEDVLGMQLPNRRSWYTNKDSLLLGTDTYIAIKALNLHH